jgi:endonuclease/exonuclease/phosphatase family metal-dependent hydrolase
MSNHVAQLKRRFLNYITEKSKRVYLSPKKQQELRIATFNVHYFTDVYEAANTLHSVIEDIKALDADFLGMQEVILGGKIRINHAVTVDVSNLYDALSEMGYHKKIFCNTVPSWYQSIYGNMLLIHNRVIKDCSDVCPKLDERIHTFEKSKQAIQVSGTHQGTKETRCYIYITYPFNQYNIHIYNTHLDVASEAERLRQVRLIDKTVRKAHKASNDVVFIIGDFNTFDRSLYDEELVMSSPYTKDGGQCVAYLQSRGYTDVHKHVNELVTTWNNMRVDFIFCNRRIVNYRAEYLYTTASDHIPVVLTLEEDFYVNPLSDSTSWFRDSSDDDYDNDTLKLLRRTRSSQSPLRTRRRSPSWGRARRSRSPPRSM